MVMMMMTGWWWWWWPFWFLSSGNRHFTFHKAECLKLVQRVCIGEKDNVWCTISISQCETMIMQMHIWWWQWWGWYRVQFYFFGIRIALGDHYVTIWWGGGGSKITKHFFLVNIDSPNLGSPYFNFLEGYQWRKNTLYDVYNFLLCVIMFYNVLSYFIMFYHVLWCFIMLHICKELIFNVKFLINIFNDFFLLLFQWFSVLPNYLICHINFRISHFLLGPSSGRTEQIW